MKSVKGSSWSLVIKAMDEIKRLNGSTREEARWRDYIIKASPVVLDPHMHLLFTNPMS